MLSKDPFSKAYFTKTLKYKVTRINMKQSHSIFKNKISNKHRPVTINQWLVLNSVGAEMTRENCARALFLVART